MDDSLTPCPKGTVTKITLLNFTIFACRRVIIPSTGLNLICGVGGSGKSSIVQAIYIGLGFKLSVLGKKKVHEYISRSNGATFCEVEIQLSDGGRRRSNFCRKFFKRSRTSDVFSINGQPATRTAYQEKVREEYKIRLENFTQYLPQSTLEKFRTLNPRDRLTGLLEAVHPELLVQRGEIIQRHRTKADRLAGVVATRKKLHAAAHRELKAMEKAAQEIRDKLASSDERRLIELGLLARRKDEAIAAHVKHKKAHKQIRAELRTLLRDTGGDADAARVRHEQDVEALQAQQGASKKALEVLQEEHAKATQHNNNKARLAHAAVQVG